MQPGLVFSLNFGLKTLNSSPAFVLNPSNERDIVIDRKTFGILTGLIGLIEMLLLLPALSLGVAGQAKKTLGFEDILSLNRASEVEISPDGRRVVFVVTTWDRENDRFNSDLWVSFDMRESGVRLTFNPKRDDRPRWAPDSMRLAFLSDRGGEASSGAQIQLLNVYAGEPTQLTSHKSPVIDFKWSPDGRFIAFTAEEPKERKFKTPPPVVVDESDSPAQLWVLDPVSKQVSQLTRGSRHITDFNWSPDGARIVYAARASSRLITAPTTEIYVVPTAAGEAPYDTGAAAQITRGNGAESDPQFSPDGKWISYLAHADDDATTGPLRIHLEPLAGGEPRVVARKFDGYIKRYRWVADSQRIVFLAGLGVRAHIFSTGLADLSPQALTRDEGASTDFSITPDGLTLVYVHENPRMPTEIVYLSSRIMIPVLITRLNPQTEPIALGQVETVRWKSNDGTMVEGLLVYPVGYETGIRYPLLTYIHGGPESAYVRGFNADWMSLPQVYAGHGYAVFMPNFRGSSNYGARFSQSNARLAGKVDYEDIVSGIDDLIKRGIADPERLAVAGWSYGAYMSGLLIGRTNRFKCAAFGAGLSNAVSYWGTADIVSQRERLHGGTPWESRRSYEEQSPLTWLRGVRVPVLIFHGEKDERVPLGQSSETYRTLKRLGVTAQLVIYPNEGHILNTPSYQLDKMQREFNWIERYIGNPKPASISGQ